MASPSQCSLPFSVSITNISKKQPKKQLSRLLTAELANVPEAATVNSPCMDNMRRAIRSQRPRIVMPNPPERAVLPQEYQTTASGEHFLKYDSGVGDGDRILVFGTGQCFNVLSTSDNWFADGTFKSCPEIFFQIYTIHALVGGRIVPCAYIYCCLTRPKQLMFVCLRKSNV